MMHHARSEYRHRLGDTGQEKRNAFCIWCVSLLFNEALHLSRFKHVLHPAIIPSKHRNAHTNSSCQILPLADRRPGPIVSFRVLSHAQQRHDLNISILLCKLKGTLIPSVLDADTGAMSQ